MVLMNNNRWNIFSTYEQWPTSPRKTRVRVFRRRPSSRLSWRGHVRSMFTPSLRRCAYQIVAGRSALLNRDLIEEDGWVNLYEFAENNPEIIIDPLGYQGQNDPPPCAPYPSCLNNNPNQNCPKDHPCRQCFIDLALGKALDHPKDKAEERIWKILYRNTTRLGKKWIKKVAPIYGEYSFFKDFYDLAECLEKCSEKSAN